jgi:uncharacterized protein YjbI with pentapeptide repeats
LSGADLRRCSLEGAALRRANLTKANLKGANLRFVDALGADMMGAILNQAEVTGSTGIIDLSGDKKKNEKKYF